MLADLEGEGIPVPPGWVIDASTFERVVDEQLPKGHDIASLIKLAGTRVGMDRAARARDRILSDPLPADLSEAVGALWEILEPVAPWGLGVRSSATCEDARGASLAGLATSIIGAQGRSAIEDAIRQVWASLYLPRTLLYLHRWSIRSVAMPVLIMPVIVARSAGVLFTSPPPGLEGDRWNVDERLVHSTFGLGAPVVDGASTVDTYRISRDGALVDEVIAEKTTMLVVDGTGLAARPIEPSQSTRGSLSREALTELAVIAKRLSHPDKPALDVEFAVESRDGAERVVVLQARPITGGVFPEGGDEKTVWSRANVGEALPGAATPLTWSIARRFSDAGFRAAFAALGCSVPKGAVLVTNVHGRFYLNLSEFMDIAGQVPGLSPRALLEQSGGAPDEIVAELEKQGTSTSKRGFLVRAPFTLPSLLMRGLRLEREVEAYEAEAERGRRQITELDLGLLPDDALSQTLASASDLLMSAGELMLTCASASLAAHLALTTWLRRVLKKRDAHGDEIVEVRLEAARVAQALTGGIAEIESANPGLALLRIANIARREPAAMAALQAGNVTNVEALPQGPTRAALLEFLASFGDRCVREAELMTPRWLEDPSSLFSMLQAALRGPAIDPDAGPGRARALADREMARLEATVGRADIRVLRALVERTQQFTRLRERMRARVTRTLGVIRLVALDIDRRLLRIEPSLPPQSVFFCTYEELFAALKTGRADVAHIIRLRRAEYLRDAGRPDPPPTFVGRPPPVRLPPSAAPRLHGLAASPGVVEGRARVVGAGADPATALVPGEILVARTTDIGMSPLFLVAAGVVTELGGPLSHAAIVAREYNVPAVVNVDGVTLSVRTGERLRVDGDRGIIEKLDAPQKAPSLVGAQPKD
ncbi:MAG: phosphoenolpyruvate synthase [Polyangiaceae bacterium]|nr:phosphoenolpyruvate synthase [Polyangiaceae bacterium]